MAKMKKLWEIDSQGNLNFTTRSGRIENAMESNSMWEKNGVIVAVLILCAVMDAFVFKQLFGVILYDHPLIQFLSIIGCLIAFDLGPIYLGNEMKKEYQGLRSSKLVQIGLIAIFVMVFIGNLWLRIMVKDILVPSNAIVEESVFKNMEDNNGPNMLALGYAIFSGLLPLATSIVSGAISFIAANPLLIKIKKVRKQKVDMEDDLVSLNAILAEYDSDSNLKERLMDEDKRMLKQKVAHVMELGLWYADYVRERLKEHGGDAAGTNELSKNMHDMLIRMHLTTGDEKNVFEFDEDGKPVSKIDYLKEVI